MKMLIHIKGINLKRKHVFLIISSILILVLTVYVLSFAGTLSEWLIRLASNNGKVDSDFTKKSFRYLLCIPIIISLFRGVFAILHQMNTQKGLNIFKYVTIAYIVAILFREALYLI